MHPTGRFDATVKSHGYSQAKSGAYQFWCVLETDHGTITAYCSLSEKAIEHTIKKIRALGFQGDDLDQLTTGDILAGNACNITVDHEEYDGKVNAKVGFINAPGDNGTPKRVQGGVANVRRFNALLKATPAVKPQTKDQPPLFDDGAPWPGDDDNHA